MMSVTVDLDYHMIYKHLKHVSKGHIPRFYTSFIGKMELRRPIYVSITHKNGKFDKNRKKWPFF